jgi:hypothetical protein
MFELEIALCERRLESDRRRDCDIVPRPPAKFEVAPSQGEDEPGRGQGPP